MITARSTLRTSANQTLALPTDLRRFMLVSLIFTLLSWVVATIVWLVGYQDRGGMWSMPGDRCADLSHYDEIFRFFHKAEFFTGLERFAYPAPAAVLYRGLLTLQPYRLPIFLCFTLLLAVVPAVFFARALVRRGVATTGAAWFVAVLLATSWPLLFLLERANIESFLVLLTFAGAFAFWRGQSVTASVLWGLAAALKVYPALLLVLFLYRGRLRAFAVGVATVAASLLLSFWYVGPTMAIAARGTMAGITGFVGSYASHSREWELRHDHSFLAFLKQPLAIHRLHFSADVSHLGTSYFVVATIAVAAIYLMRFRRLPVLNQYLLATIAMVALPPVSYDYTLMHLYPGFVLVVLLLLRNERDGRKDAAVSGLIWCFTLIFASENFAFWIAFHLNGMVKAAALFWAAVLLLRHPLRVSEPALEFFGGRARRAGELAASDTQIPARS